jgi:hypothetical protein
MEVTSFLLLLLSLCFFPSIIGAGRRHRRVPAIVIANLSS